MCNLRLGTTALRVGGEVVLIYLTMTVVSTWTCPPTCTCTCMDHVHETAQNRHVSLLPTVNYLSQDTLPPQPLRDLAMKLSWDKRNWGRILLCPVNWRSLEWLMNCPPRNAERGKASWHDAVDLCCMCIRIKGLQCIFGSWSTHARNGFRPGLHE